MKINFTGTEIGSAIGRILLASLFILAGLNKIANYSVTLELMANKGLSPAFLLLPLAILFELGGGILVAVGRHGAAIAAILLTAFTITTNIYFHDFWHADASNRTIQLSLFLKNIAISGGLLFFAATQFRRSDTSTP